MVRSGMRERAASKSEQHAEGGGELVVADIRGRRVVERVRQSQVERNRLGDLGVENQFRPEEPVLRVVLEAGVVIGLPRDAVAVREIIAAFEADMQGGVFVV